MKKECTEQDLRELARSAQAVFEAVTLTEAPLCDGWQDDGLRVDYELRNGRVDCVLHRRVEADGKCWELEMCAPLAGNVLPEERMTPRERELCREDMSHDFLTGVYNRRYLETVFAQKLEQCAAQGRKAAVALVSIDNGQKLRDTYGQPVMDQLHCFVGNQWKKSFDTPATRVVCRLTGSIFAVGCLDADGKQLAEEMQNLYQQMPRECITTTGMMRRVPFTLSCGVASLEDVPAKNWQALYELCDARLRGGTERRRRSDACRIKPVYKIPLLAQTKARRGIFCMENQKNDNLNLLEAVVQNTEMGKNTLEQIVPMTDDVQFKAELLRQRNVYHQLNQEAHTAIEACGGTAQGQSAMAKLNTKMGISMKTLTDKSTRNLAEMLTQGSGMGVVDCVKAQKDYPNAAPGAKRLAQRLQEFQEDSRVKLEQFL